MNTVVIPNVDLKQLSVEIEKIADNELLANTYLLETLLKWKKDYDGIYES